MGFTNFISETEAMHVCGVSAKTLSRFAEAGYLSIEKESDGLTLYSSDELEKVFGKSVAAKRPSRRIGPVAQKPPVIPIHAAPLDGYETSDSAHVSTADTASWTDTACSTADNRATKREQIVSSREEHLAPHSTSEKVTSHQSGERESSECGQEIRPDRDDTKANDAHTMDVSQKVTTNEPVSTAQETTPAMSSYSSESKTDVEGSADQYSKEKTEPTTSVREMTQLNEKDELVQLRADKVVLERINEVNEKIIELREERIQEVSKERDWLRERVEKLEQKAERDQILLMSETQLLRQVMEQNALQRSPVRKALEWIGLIDPPKSPFQSGKDRVVLGE